MKCKALIVSVVAVLLYCSFAFAQKLDENLARGVESIQPMDPYNYCKTLASPQFAGRLTGHEGYTSAAKWAAGKFEQWGLKPVNEHEGYLRAYPSPYTLVEEAEMTLLIPEETGEEKNRYEEISLKVGEDFLPLLFTDSGDHTAELAFAGWGISAPKLGYDDYAGIDVNDKFVLCFRGTPDRSEKGFTKHDHHRFRMQTAKGKGALGLLYIYPEPIANPNGDWIEDFTPAMISDKTADKILAEKKLGSSELKEDLLKYKRPLSFHMSSRIRYRVRSRHFPDAVGYNIVVYVEGSDAKLKTECLVIGGHFDHCGCHLGMLFAGADDNASGSAVVMEIAEAFSKLKVKPKRSVVFVLFGGEEMGLMGSNYFADHLPSQFERMDAMFNFDMTGEGEGTNCACSADAPKLKQLLEESDMHVGTIRRVGTIRTVGVRSSDYAPFFTKGANVVNFASNGPHLHYHKTGDTIYRINPDIMADMARLAFIAAFRWANR